jgi:hypothetical protein
MNENRVIAQLSNSAGEKEQKYMFYCEGCKENHMFDERWSFNGDVGKPTPILSKAEPRPNQDYKLMTWIVFFKIRACAQTLADELKAPVEFRLYSIRCIA